MSKNFFLLFKDLSLNNIILLGCLISNSYSNYVQYKKNQEILAIIREERRNIVELLDNKLEKFNYSLQLWTEKSNVGIEKVKNKISLIQDKMVDQHFLLTSNIMQPQKVDSSFKIALFDQFLPSSFFQLIVFGILISCCAYSLYFCGYLNPWSYFEVLKLKPLNNVSSNGDMFPKENFSELVGKDNNISLNTTQDVVVIDTNSSQSFTPSAEDLEVINTYISSLFK